jgi:hypothetical protein
MSNMIFDSKTGEIIERGHSGGGYKLEWYDKPDQFITIPGSL